MNTNYGVVIVVKLTWRTTGSIQTSNSFVGVGFGRSSVAHYCLLSSSLQTRYSLAVPAAPVFLFFRRFDQQSTITISHASAGGGYCISCN
jgi:hypothetical protein